MVCACNSVSDHHQHHDDLDDEYDNNRAFYYNIMRQAQFTAIEKELVEALVWFKKNSPKIERLKANSSKPLEVLVPKRKGGSWEGSISTEVRSTKQEAKTINTAVGVVQFLNPPSIIVPKKKRGTGNKFVKEINKYVSTYIHDDKDQKLKTIEKQEERTIRKPSFKRKMLDEEEEEDEGNMTKKLRKKTEKVDFKKMGFDPRRPLPDFTCEIKNRISWKEDTNTDFKFRIMKQLFHSDMNRELNRLSMPLKQIQDYQDFLNDTEKMEVCNDKSEGIDVEVFDLLRDHDENGKGKTMRLRQWDMKTSSSYMLTTSWNSVLDRHEGVLKLNDIVQVYSFRRKNEEEKEKGKLCLVLVKVSDGKGCKEGAFGSSTTQGNGGRATIPSQANNGSCCASGTQGNDGDVERTSQA